MDLDAWTAGAICEDDGIAFCHRCRPRDFPPLVFITSGGSAFHRTPTCELLASGQDRVAQRGGSPAVPEQVAVHVAIGLDRFPCQGCFPEERGRV